MRISDWSSDVCSSDLPLTVAGEYGRLSIDRLGSAPSADFDGFYAYATYFLTGESRSFKNGTFDRVKPIENFGQGGLGAWELATRLDSADLTDRKRVVSGERVSVRVSPGGCRKH